MTDGVILKVLLLVQWNHFWLLDHLLPAPHLPLLWNVSLLPGTKIWSLGELEQEERGGK